MTLRWAICFSLAALPLAAATVTGRVELRDSRDPAVRNRADFSGVVISLKAVTGGTAPPGSAKHSIMKINSYQGSAGGAETMYSQNGVVGSLPGVVRSTGGGGTYNGQENGDECNQYGTSNPAAGSSPSAFTPVLGGSASTGTLFDQLINGLRSSSGCNAQ